jgi:hypothetical protein
MKRFLLLSLVVMLFGFTGQSQAAKVSYSPADLNMEAAPGEKVNVPVTVGADGLTGYLIMKVGGQGTGDLPPGWVTEKMVILSQMQQKFPTSIEITVPADATPGEYSTRLSPEIQYGPTDVELGDGIGVKLMVAAASTCTAPLIEDLTVGPPSLFLPDGKDVLLKVSGLVKMENGCGQVDVKCNFDDEYGEFSRHNDSVALDENGRFELNIPVVASRHGEDKDGRLYSGTITATNDGGTSSGSFSAKIEHDMRGGKDK